MAILASVTLLGLTACDDGGSSNRRNNYCYTNNGYTNGYNGYNTYNGYNQYQNQIVGYDYYGNPIYANNGVNNQYVNPYNQYNNVNGYNSNCAYTTNGNSAYAVRYDCNSVYNNRPIQDNLGRCDINGNQLYY